MEPATTVQIDPPGDYRLEHTMAFLTGFVPQPVTDHGDGPAELRFAAPLPPSWDPVEVVVTQPERRLEVRWVGPGTPGDIARHVQRILSLDVDATGFAPIVVADPILSEVVDLEAGIRPSLFWTPYEAAVWAVLSQRSRMSQATTVKTRLAVEHGSSPGSRPSTPGPEQLLTLRSAEGVGETKLQRLHDVARAALDGTLDPDGLRRQSPRDALRALEAVPGVGPFSAELVLVRGAGAPDVFPIHERRLHGIMRERYGRPDATPADLARIAEDWRPFRSWISFQFRRAASGSTRTR